MKTDTGTRRHGDAETITFTAAEIEVLRRSAEMTEQYLRSEGLRFKPYQVKRYEFAKEWAEGNHWNSKKSTAWAEKIKRELKAAKDLMRRRGSAGSAGATTSGSACGKRS